MKKNHFLENFHEKNPKKPIFFDQDFGKSGFFWSRFRKKWIFLIQISEKDDIFHGKIGDFHGKNGRFNKKMSNLLILFSKFLQNEDKI